MDLRKELGGKVEAILNAAIDEHLSAEKIAPFIGLAVEKLLGEQLDKVKNALKQAVDKIDGEDDIA